MQEHGEDILRALPVDNPGVMSEQGSECNNRWWRHFREFNARKTSVSTSLRDPFVRKAEMADPEILAINANYVRGDNRRRKRKKVAKVSTPLPEGVVALFTDEAQQKYLAQSNSMEVDEASSSDPPTPVTPALEPQPGPSGRGNQIDSEEEVESASDDDDEDFDNLVFVFDEDEDDNDIDLTPQPDMETEELDTSLNVRDLKRKSKSVRKKVAKIRILESSDSEKEFN